MLKHGHVLKSALYVEYLNPWLYVWDNICINEGDLHTQPLDRCWTSWCVVYCFWPPACHAGLLWKFCAEAVKNRPISFFPFGWFSLPVGMWQTVFGLQIPSQGCKKLPPGPISMIPLWGTFTHNCWIDEKLAHTKKLFLAIRLVHGINKEIMKWKLFLIGGYMQNGQISEAEKWRLRIQCIQHSCLCASIVLSTHGSR